jgi:uncharacterized protein YndB with AHSA1/START domain
MTAPHDDDRTVRAEVDVPGTPEEVWAAIATGPGITAWFVPAEVEEREGGAVRLHFGPLGDDEGIVTAWDPPRHVAFRGGDGVAHEVTVEARSGGMCLVRLVNHGFTSDWDDELDAVGDGWRKHLHQLRLYRTHFPGERCATVYVTGSAAGPPAEALAALTAALDMPAAPAPGERVAVAAPGAAERDEAAWHAWMADRFPFLSPASAT